MNPNTSTGPSFGPRVLLVLPAIRNVHSDPAPWWLFSTEILGHAGLSFRVLERPPTELPAEGTLLFAMPPTLNAEESERLRIWVQGGGSVVAVGGAGDLAAIVPVTDGADVPPGERVVVDGYSVSLPTFGGRTLVKSGDQVRTIARSLNGGTVACAVSLGAGSVQIWGVDLWQTVVRILQGWPVERDGKPAPDGSMPLNDGVLKCDDGIALDLELDRRVPPGQPAALNPYPYEFPPATSPPVFATPVADVWRDAFLRGMLAPLGGEVGTPFVEYWPDGEAAVVHISQDADGNLPEEATAALALWEELDVRTTWCMLFPGGYGGELLGQILNHGHEAALHFSAMGDTEVSRWGLVELRAQLDWLRAWTGGLPVVTNKNHYTRWEGWSQFFVWCEQLGIQLDQSRGASKLGGVGFPFGTTHLWRPLTDGVGDGRLVDVLAMPLHTQDLGLAAHESVRDVILDGALEHGGVAHFLYHPTHIRERELVRGTCRRLVEEVRRRGMRILTAREINAWERIRRTIALEVVERSAEGLVLNASAPSAVRATIAVPVCASEAVVRVDGAQVRSEVTRRRGLDLVLASVDVPADPGSVRVEVQVTTTL